MTKPAFHSGALPANCLALLLLLACGGAADQLDSNAPAVEPKESSTPGEPSTTSEPLTPSEPHTKNEDAGMPRSSPPSSKPRPAPTSSAAGDSVRAGAGTRAAEFQGLTKVQLHFQDASVPPEYHRSYTITAEPYQVAVSVDVYGEVIALEEASLSSEQWLALAELVAALPDALAPDAEAVGTQSVTLNLWGETGSKHLRWAKSAPTASATASVSASVSAGLQASVNLQRHLEGLIPNLEQLLATEYAP